MFICHSQWVYDRKRDGIAYVGCAVAGEEDLKDKEIQMIRKRLLKIELLLTNFTLGTSDEVKEKISNRERK